MKKIAQGSPQHRIRTRVLLVEPGGLKWTSDFPQKYGIYTGTKDADKKNSRKVISNFEKCVNLYSRME